MLLCMVQVMKAFDELYAIDRLNLGNFAIFELFILDIVVGSVVGTDYLSLVVFNCNEKGWKKLEVLTSYLF